MTEADGLPYPGLPARFEFDGGGIAFRIWTRPVVEGDRITPATMVWRHPDGATGRRRCGSFLEAHEHAARVIAAASMGVKLCK